MKLTFSPSYRALLNSQLTRSLTDKYRKKKTYVHLSTKENACHISLRFCFASVDRLIFKMRLLNTETKEIKDFGAKPSFYVILSHRWLEEEVTFQDTSRPDVEQMKGYAKLSAACAMARRLGFYYLWMDTCCIDKSSSSELSESINSMYTVNSPITHIGRWTQNAMGYWNYGLEE